MHLSISRLEVTNFRGFEQLTLDFDPKVTVLVGINGAGKSSLLYALTIGLSAPLRRIAGPPGLGTAFADADVREGSIGAQLKMAARIGNDVAIWSDHKIGMWTETTQRWVTDQSALITASSDAQASIELGAPNLPLAVYFPASRGALDVFARTGMSQLPNPPDGHRGAPKAYDGALTAGGGNFGRFFDWFREEEDLFNEQVVQQGVAPKDVQSSLSQVRRAIEALFPDGKSLRIERKSNRMTIERAGVRLDVGQLSDGEKGLLVMAGDLARRMVIACPEAEKPLEEHVVVLIDEIELHLHPGLQREVLARLRKAFPNAQFIVSTHSPQVVSSVRADQVRLLENFKLRKLDRGTWHRDTNSVLEAAFGDPGRSPEIAAQIGDLRDAIDEDRFEEARAMIDQLRHNLDKDDPEVFYLEQFLPPESKRGEEIETDHQAG